MSDLPNAASVALVRDDKVLLIKRAFAPYQHLWTLPGGRREPSESIETCARREIAEELGLTVSEVHHVLTQTLSTGYRLAVFASTGFEGTITPSDEIADYRWVTLPEAAEMRTTSRLDRILARAFALTA
jgi:8-oxo-dGTP diphosphatase